MTRCNGQGCCARRDCSRWVAYDYWVASDLFEPAAGYQCSGYIATVPQQVPAWAKRIPELRQ